MKNRPVKDDRMEPQFGYNARRNEPYFDEPRAKTAPNATRVRRRERSLLPVFLVGAIIILFAGFLWISYVKGPKIIASGQLPVITADTTPVKVKPDNPGGAEIPFQNTTVYDDLNQGKQKHPGPEVEHLLAPPEQPMAIPAPVAAASAPVADVAPPAAPQPVKPDDTQAAPQAVLLPPPSDTTPTATPENEAVLAPPEPVTPAPAVNAPKPAPTAQATKAKPVAPTAGPHNSAIQLGSFKDEAAANAEWQRLKTRYSDQLAALSPNVMQVDLGEKGTWYRLRAGPLTADKAKAACAFLTNAKAPCIVQSR